MNIKPEEVQEVKVVGKLFGDDVKVVQLKGGFNVAMGKKERNSNKAEALAAGSHIGLVTYQIEKIHGADFEPAIYKSEAEALPSVEDRTGQLPDMAKNAGIELYVMSKLNHLDFVLCKNNIELAKIETEYAGTDLHIKDSSFRESISPNMFVSQALSKAMSSKMKELNLTTVKK
jgi:hypothetical protein